MLQKTQVYPMRKLCDSPLRRHWLREALAVAKAVISLWVIIPGFTVTS